MEWQAIRAVYPHQWVVLEVIAAYDTKDHYIITDCIPYGGYSEFRQAWDAHIALSKKKESCFAHTTTQETLTFEKLPPLLIIWNDDE